MRSTFKVLFYLKRDAKKQQKVVLVMGRITINDTIARSFLKNKYRVNDIALIELEASFIDMFHVYLQTECNLKPISACRYLVCSCQSGQRPLSKTGSCLAIP